MSRIMRRIGCPPRGRCPGGRRRAGLLLVAAGLVVFGGESAARAQCMYEVVATLTGPECSPGVFASFAVLAMDDGGNIVGFSSCGGSAFASIWTGGPTAQWLPSPPDTGVTGANDIVSPDLIVGGGTPNGGTTVGVLWEAGQGILLPVLPGSNFVTAVGVNPGGQIAGRTNNSLVADSSRAVLWESQVIQELELPFGHEAEARDISTQGQITGWMGDSLITDAHAFIWDNGVVIDLGVIPGGTTAEGKAINNRGHVAGFGRVPDGVSLFGLPHAFFWNGTTMIDLGVLPGREESFANDLNDVDQVVGSSVGGGTSHRGYLWQDGEMFELTDLVITDLGGISVGAARAINNNGWIVAATTLGQILLRPVDSAPGDVDNNCIVDINDFLLVIGEWGRSNSFADTNDDGVVNIDDFLRVLGDWG